MPLRGTVGWILVLLAASLLSGRAAADALLDFAVPGGVKAGVMVSEDAAAGGIPANTAFDVDPDGLPAVADGGRLKLFGSAQELLTLNTPKIDDFAWMRDGKLLLVTQGRLAAVSPEGIVPSLALPSAKMRIRPAGADTAYVFGGPQEPANHGVYIFSRQGKIAKLVDLPDPITAVAGDGSTTYVAAGNVILRIAVNEPIRAILKTKDPIISIESAPDDALFYSTKSSVGYVDHLSRAFDFIRGEGGLLRARGSMLYVLLSNGALLRIGSTDKFAGALAPPDSEIAAKGENERIANAALIAEVEDRLYELNFDPGRRDGGLDDATELVIRQYEQMSGRAVTGRATYGLLKSLRAAGSRAPWASIVFAKTTGKWGMAWGKNSRKVAVTQAVSSCGDPKLCVAELSFYGTDCAAFAYSEKDWAITARNTISLAREATLGECQKAGAECRIVATVCADGSNHSEAGK